MKEPSDNHSSTVCVICSSSRRSRSKKNIDKETDSENDKEFSQLLATLRILTDRQRALRKSVSNLIESDEYSVLKDDDICNLEQHSNDKHGNRVGVASNEEYMKHSKVKSKPIPSVKNVIDLRNFCQERKNALQDLKMMREKVKGIKYNIQDSFKKRDNLKRLLLKQLPPLTNKLEIERYKCALELFSMMPIGVDHNLRSNINQQHREERKNIVLHLTGCSTILGLPIQNNGVYNGTPYDILAGAIMHITHLFNSLSSALNIPSTHTVDPSTLQIIPSYAKHRCLHLLPIIYNEKEGDEDHINQQKINTMNNNVQMRCDSLSSITNSRQDVRDNSVLINTSFREAMHLLQDNILSLCLTMGIKVSRLWPREAMLLNLDQIRLFLSDYLTDKESQTRDNKHDIELVPIVYQSDKDIGAAVTKKLLSKLFHHNQNTKLEVEMLYSNSKSVHNAPISSETARNTSSDVHTSEHMSKKSIDEWNII